VAGAQKILGWKGEKFEWQQERPYDDFLVGLASRTKTGKNLLIGKPVRRKAWAGGKFCGGETMVKYVQQGRMNEKGGPKIPTLGGSPWDSARRGGTNKSP